MKLKSSIILVVIIGLLIPVTVSSLFILDKRKQELYQRLRSDQERTLEILALGMQEPLWNYNAKGALPLFLSILNDTRIISINVLDNKNSDFIYRSIPERQRGTVSLLEKKVVYQDQEIGKVVIEFDSYQSDQEILRSRIIFGGTATAQLLLSLILIVSLIQKRILDPIRRLMKDSASLSKKLLTTPFVWNDKDEWCSDTGSGQLTG